MPFVIGRGFANVQILIKVKVALSQTFWNISIKFCIHVDIDKLQSKGLPNVIFHTTLSRLCRGKNSKIKKPAIALEQCYYFDKSLHTH